LATAKSKRWSSPRRSVKRGAASVLPRSTSAAVWPCRIMFMRAIVHVATSISCPKMVNLWGASSEALISSEPEPQVGS